MPFPFFVDFGYSLRNPKSGNPVFFQELMFSGDLHASLVCIQFSKALQRRGICNEVQSTTTGRRQRMDDWM